MSSIIWVKVVGFRDVERHSINTLLRLSENRSPAYALWTRDAPALPQVMLLDVDSYEAGLELASPNFNANLKLICVGSEPPGHAWRSFARPVDWEALVRVLDGLFGSPSPDKDFDVTTIIPVPPGVRVSLVVGMSLDERMYLRARLALAGLTDVDEVQTPEQARERTSHRSYDLVIVGLDAASAAEGADDPWALVELFKQLPEPPHAIVVATATPSWAVMERAESMGCLGLLEIPFNPQQVLGLLQKV